MESVWGPAFHGLHSLMAFETEAGDNNDFCSNFPLNFLGFDFGIVSIQPVTIVQAWMSAANAANIGSPAAMGPIQNITIRGFRDAQPGLAHKTRFGAHPKSFQWASQAEQSRRNLDRFPW